jgi:hypothetical protein
MNMAVRHIPWISPDEYWTRRVVHGMLAINLGAELRAAERTWVPGSGQRRVIPDWIGVMIVSGQADS